MIWNPELLQLQRGNRKWSWNICPTTLNTSKNESCEYVVLTKMERRQLTHCPHCPLAGHDDVIKWKHFPRHWPFVRKIHRSPVNFPHKGQWRGALMFSLIYVWINDWANNREAGDLRRQHGHYDVIVMRIKLFKKINFERQFLPAYLAHFPCNCIMFSQH